MTRFPYILLLCLALSLIRCSKDDPVGPSRDDFRYPLEPGNTWIYDRSIKMTFQPRSGTRAPDSTGATVRVEVIGAEVIFDTLATIKVRERVEQDGAFSTSYHHYQNNSDALYLVATVGSPVTLPKKTAAMNRLFEKVWEIPFDLMSLFEENRNSAADSLHLEKPVKTVLQYPLKAGAEWTFSEKNRPRRIRKRVIGEEDVKTKAVTFKTVKIQWIVDFDGDGEFDSNVEYFDYIANEGLVKRSFVIRNLPLLDDEGGNIGSYDYQDQSLLVSFVVK
ncbi:hypothetical protein JW998_02475 [candidate division KSB1 bacterium]|nr:hypothetical protein [candidate division KSB1 bacterium]